MKFATALVLIFFALRASAQQYLFGKIVSEDGVPISGISIHNISKEIKTVSDYQGNFMIAAEPGNLIRIVSSRYERENIYVTQKDFISPVQVTIVRLADEIEEVTIKYKPTGNLKEDSDYYNERETVKKMRTEVSDYIARKSDLSVMQPQPGGFVQPVGPGFSVGKVSNKWDDLDFIRFLQDEFEENFFTEELMLHKQQIEPFIRYVLTDFDRKNILKYGNPTTEDVFRFMNEARRKITDYQIEFSGKR